MRARPAKPASPSITMTALAIPILALALASSPLSAAAPAEKKEEPRAPVRQEYKGSASVLAGITMTGVQGEYTFVPHMGIRAVALAIFGADFNAMNRDEYILSAIVTPVLHLGPELQILDPVLMLGFVYSYHHWETKPHNIGLSGTRTIREGNFHDFTFGVGMGFNFKFADRFKIGINLWLNYDYGVVITYSLKKEKGRRMILPVPIIECTVRF